MLKNDKLDDIINGIIRKYPEQYHDDLYQECQLYALTVESTFSGTEDDFIRYLRKSLWGICKNFLNPKRGNERIIDDANNLPLDTVVFSAGEFEVTIEDTLTDGSDLYSEIEARDYINELDKTRSVRDMKILNYINYGYSAREVVDLFPELGLSSFQQVYNILKTFQR